MDVSCKQIVPLFIPEIDSQIIDVAHEASHQILISEREYLELKCSVGYWQAMHKKAICREKQLKQKILEQAGQIRDLRNRVLGKKSEKKTAGKDNGRSKPDTPKRPRGQQPGSEGLSIKSWVYPFLPVPFQAG